MIFVEDGYIRLILRCLYFAFKNWIRVNTSRMSMIFKTRRLPIFIVYCSAWMLGCPDIPWWRVSCSTFHYTIATLLLHWTSVLSYIWNQPKVFHSKVFRCSVYLYLTCKIKVMIGHLEIYYFHGCNVNEGNLKDKCLVWVNVFFSYLLTLM